MENEDFENALYLWGSNRWGKLGDGTTEDTLKPMNPIQYMVKEDIGMGGSHNAFVTKDGELYLWGNNQYGQIGNGYG